MFLGSPERPRPTTTFHRVLSFNDYSNRYLQTLQKGSTVYVEAGFELREPDRDADPTTPQGQRQIYLKHGSLRVYSVTLECLILFYTQRLSGSLGGRTSSLRSNMRSNMRSSIGLERKFNVN